MASAPCNEYLKNNLSSTLQSIQNVFSICQAVLTMSEETGPGKECVHLFMTPIGYRAPIDLTSRAMHQALENNLSSTLQRIQNVFSICQSVLTMSERTGPELKKCVHLFVTEWLPDVHRSSKWNSATGKWRTTLWVRYRLYKRYKTATENECVVCDSEWPSDAHRSSECRYETSTWRTASWVRYSLYKTYVWSIRLSLLHPQKRHQKTNVLFVIANGYMTIIIIII